MPNGERPELTLFLDILHKLEELQIPYVIIGGFAATMYGITRATFDIDIIVDLEEAHIESLSQAYPLPRYYADPHQMRNAMRIGSSFNIIDTSRGEKADLFPVTIDVRNRPALRHRVHRLIDLPGMEPFQVWVARPEDVITGKLMAWAEGRSQRHEADISEMMLFYYLSAASGEPFDEKYVTMRADELGPETGALWRRIITEAQAAAKLED